MVGDWDFASTLMRTAAQGNAGRMMVALDAMPETLLPIGVEVERVQAARVLLLRIALYEDGWASRALFNPLARKLGLLAVDLGIEARWVSLAGMICLAGSSASALAGWIVASLALYLVAECTQRTGDLLIRASMAAVPWQRWRDPVRWGTGGVVGVAAGITLFFRTLQWGCGVLSIVAVGAQALLKRVEPVPTASRTDPGGLALIGLAGMASGWPVAALTLVALLAIGDLTRAIFRQA